MAQQPAASLEVLREASELPAVTLVALVLQVLEGFALRNTMPSMPSVHTHAEPNNTITSILFQHYFLF